MLSAAHRTLAVRGDPWPTTINRCPGAKESSNNTKKHKSVRSS